MVELLVILVIIAILVTLAVPSFGDKVRKARRADSQQALADWATRMEIWRANNPIYGTAVQVPPPTNSDYFDYAVTSNTASTFTINATAKGGQVKDQESGTSCATLTLDQSGGHPGGEGDCWN